MDTQADKQGAALSEAPSDAQLLDEATDELGRTAEPYAAEFFGHFLNEQQIDPARTQVAEMETAANRLYDIWQKNRNALPASAEIGAVVEPATFKALFDHWRSSRDWSRAPWRGRRFTKLVQLNEQVRRTTESATEALPVLRNQILYARHFERNCLRLYGSEHEQFERLRDAEEMRLSLEQTLGAIQGDVDSLRGQTQSLTLYAQMHLAIQVQLLTWILLVVTVAGVVAAFVHH
jgi:hypothetical protein